MLVLVSGQAKDCGSSSGREAAPGAGAACPMWLQRPRSPCAPHLGLAWSKGDVGSTVPGGRGSLSSYSSPAELPSSHVLPPKAPEQCPLSLLLRGADGHGGIKGHRNAGDSWHECRAQAPALGRWKGRPIPPRLPSSPFPTALCWQRPQVLQAPKSRVPASTGSGEAGASTPSPLRRWFSMPEPDLGILS